MKFHHLSYLISLLLLSSTISKAQKCQRPDEVYINLNSITEKDLIDIGTNYIYNTDSSEAFLKMNHPIEITKSAYKDLKFYSTKELRNIEEKVRQCEIANSEDKVYVDIDVNSIFKVIYVVLKTDDKMLKLQVRWHDTIE